MRNGGQRNCSLQTISSLIWIGIFVTFCVSILLNIISQNIHPAVRTEIRKETLKLNFQGTKGVKSGKNKYTSAWEEKNTENNGQNSLNKNVGATGLINVSPQKSSDQHKIANLSCEKYGGSSDDMAQEMMYWSDIPSDSSFVSPLKKEEDKYLIFEKNSGGWNNVRMALETIIAMAHAMGRTLVLPPEQIMHMLTKDEGKQKNRFSFTDFFHLGSLNAEHGGMNIITMEEFLNRMAMAGKLVSNTSGKVVFPQDNRTDWNQHQDVKKLNFYLRDVTHVIKWNPKECIAAFPASPGPEGIIELQKMMKKVLKKKPKKFINKPVPVDAPAKERLREMLAKREKLCMYDDELQKASVINFISDKKKKVRLLVNFYEFLFFEDWKQDLWTKRFVRDHLRYIDELQCAAAQVVRAVREKAKIKNPQNNPDGLYDSFHIRRGDFLLWYKSSDVEADVIYNNSKDELEEGSTVYISTDEQSKDFFKPLAEHYDIYFLDDFKYLIEGLNTNYYGMLDLLIASKGRVFFGTWKSTFTGYINRLRGYHASKYKMEGYENGTIKSYYYIPLKKKFQMQAYHPVTQPFWEREFPAAWRDIDKGIGELGTYMKEKSEV